MNTFTFVITGLLLSTTAIAGTSKELDYSEQQVVAYEFAQVFPALLQGNNGILETCNLSNIAEPGKASVLEVSCDFISPLSFRGNVTFDQIMIDHAQKIIGATFKSLKRR